MMQQCISHVFSSQRGGLRERRAEGVGDLRKSVRTQIFQAVGVSRHRTIPKHHRRPNFVVLCFNESNKWKTLMLALLPNV